MVSVYCTIQEGHVSENSYIKHRFIWTASPQYIYFFSFFLLTKQTRLSSSQFGLRSQSTAFKARLKAFILHQKVWLDSVHGLSKTALVVVYLLTRYREIRCLPFSLAVMCVLFNLNLLLWGKQTCRDNWKINTNITQHTIKCSTFVFTCKRIKMNLKVPYFTHFQILIFLSAALNDELPKKSPS